MVKVFNSENFVALNTGAYLSKTEPYMCTAFKYVAGGKDLICLPQELENISPLYIVVESTIGTDPIRVAIFTEEPRKLQPVDDTKVYHKDRFSYSDIGSTCEFPTNFGHVEGYLVICTGLKNEDYFTSETRLF